ncbi:glycosyltransferase [Leptolyngbya boryana CZ1]|uniref:Glycosyltransferase n=1 Tax=Leptolyngbya boryana CZ1 TaxID=3060204 RepID=A0AA96WQI1_LEPBY|nr:glycosyltransferase [Leptolyngbya boryana]WNZ43992.1 glycosyltransferase [Leptolyngbya boryana CZ1]
MQELQIISYPVQLANFDLAGGLQGKPQKIFACPNPPVEAIEAGVAIAVPSGKFDVGLILDQLPAQFEPDVLFMSARNLEFRPLNLAKFRCPKVMKLGDTNHMGNGTLSEMIEYCQSIGSDYHWIYQGVQHLHFFQEAGLSNVFWLPGSIVLNPFVPEQKSHKRYDVCFRGSLSNTHRYRQKLVEFLQANHVNISIAQKSYHDSLVDYAESRIVFNCSGGGDFNRRVFEVLMAGGFLLTDRLRPHSGLPSLFQEGVHLECYGSPKELLEKVDYYLAHPARAEEIALAGQRKFHQDYHPDLIKEKFHRFIFEGELEAPFRVQNDKRFTILGSAKRKIEQNQLQERLKLYELVQSIHHLNDSLDLLYWKPGNYAAISDLADLPRLNLTCALTSQAIASFSNWLERLELTSQVHAIPVSSSSELGSVAMIVMEFSGQVQPFANDLKTLAPSLKKGGVVLVLGGHKHLDSLAQLFPGSRWEKVELLEINSHRSIVAGFAKAYRKRSRYFKSGSLADSLQIFVHEKLALSTKVKIKLKGAMTQFVR